MGIITAAAHPGALTVPPLEGTGTIVSAPGATALQDCGLELVVESVQADDKAHEASRKPPPPTARLWKMSKPHMPVGILGITAAAAYGAVLPLFGFILGHIIADLYLQDEDLMRSRVQFWCIIFVCLGKQQQTIVKWENHSSLAAAFSLMVNSCHCRCRGFPGAVRIQCEPHVCWAEAHQGGAGGAVWSHAAAGNWMVR